MQIHEDTHRIVGSSYFGKGHKANADKMSAIKEMPAPRNPKEIKQFLGLVGYHQKFIPRFSDIAKPLTR